MFRRFWSLMPNNCNLNFPVSVIRLYVPKRGPQCESNKVSAYVSNQQLAYHLITVYIFFYYERWYIFSYTQAVKISNLSSNELWHNLICSICTVNAIVIVDVPHCRHFFCLWFSVSMFWSVDRSVRRSFNLLTFWPVNVWSVDILLCRFFAYRRFGMPTFRSVEIFAVEVSVCWRFDYLPFRRETVIWNSHLRLDFIEISQQVTTIRLCIPWWSRMK